MADRPPDHGDARPQKPVPGAGALREPSLADAKSIRGLCFLDCSVNPVNGSASSILGHKLSRKAPEEAQQDQPHSAGLGPLLEARGAFLCTTRASALRPERHVPEHTKPGSLCVALQGY